MTVILLVFAAIILAVCLCRKSKLSGNLSQIPGPKGQIPLLGITHKFIGAEISDYIKILLDLFSHTEPIQKTWFGTQLVVVVNTPEMFKTVLTSPDCLRKPQLVYDGILAKRGLLSNNGSMQEKHRRILNHSMTPNMLNELNPIFNEKIKKFIGKMDGKADGNEFNVFSDVAACTLEALVKGNFLYDIDCYESDLLKACESSNPIIMRRIMQPWMAIDAIFKMSQLSKDAKKTFEPIYRHIDRMLEINQHSRVESDRKQGVFIQQLLNLKHQFSEEEIRDEMFILIFAGFETSATSLAITLLLLAMHKHIQQKVIDEVDSMNFDESFTISNEETQHFPYIEMVLKEVARLFPIGPVILREASKEIELHGFEIPTGTMLALPIYFIHRNESIWGSDVKDFNPGRFESEKIKKIHPYAFVPFSGGKRMCLGHKYAMIFMKIFIVNFFKNFEVDTSLKFEDLTIKISPTLSLDQGYPVRVTRRKNTDRNL